MTEADVKVARPSCFCHCWGAKCRYCKVWITKHDFTPEEAMACALADTEHACRP